MNPTPDEIRDWQEQWQTSWQETLEEMNDQVNEAVETNIEAQTAFVQSWLEAMEEASDDARYDDAMEGYRRAYETWMSAAEETIQSLGDAAEGEDVSVTQFRDTWLEAANESFKELMSTTAFAAATGESVEDLLEFKQQRDEATEAMLHDLGFPALTDIQEVGERLIELERRQHAVEEKLDRILDAIDE